MMLALNEKPVGTRLGRDGFARLTGAPPEMMTRLDAYVALLAAWNRRVNLVGASTIGDVWRRHILDSAQLYPLLPEGPHVVADFGSGAGLPGIVLAVMGVKNMHLIESDQRKIAFLREAARVTGARVTIHPQRAEQLVPFEVGVVVARAVAPLDELLHLVYPFLDAHSICLFLKGKGTETELAAAQANWRFKAEQLPSRSDPGGRVLRLEGVQAERDAAS
jgi:16S rRNA (guanine527-N7)-methyltransferase